jgi:hypothetical protein
LVTPIGIFELGYEAFELKRRSDYQPNYTYVVIKSITTEKEYIYRVNDGKELRLRNRGECEVLIRKNRVIITIGRGSTFKAEFYAVDGNRQSTSRSSGLTWLDVSRDTCERYGGELYIGICKADWDEAKNICSAMSARLPSVNELNAVTKTCGGTPVRYGSDDFDSISNKNRANSSYQSCYKRKGFSNNDFYWSSTSFSGKTDNAWFAFFRSGRVHYDTKGNSYYFKCVR